MSRHFSSLAACIALSCLLALAGCGGDGASAPSPVINESFQTDSQQAIAIRADALNREFLLQGNLVQLEQAPAFRGLKSRIVVFQKKGNKVYMLESQIGHTVMPDTPFALLLAEFPVTAEQDGWIWFDFNQGMSKIFSTREVFTSDYDGKDYWPSFTVESVRSSYLDQVDISKNNRLAMRQVAQIDGSDQTLRSVQVHYYLSPYLPDTSFVATESPGFRYAGYFEVMPQNVAGGATTQVRATKWQIGKQPVTYFISANTPAEYRESVKNGVLYWNQALGQEVFAVADAPAGVTAPDMDRNMIQWVTDDQAGMAYADIQADPRTGQILHAQVFMTSMWAVSTRSQAWQALKLLGEPLPSATQITLKNLHAPSLCNLSARDGMVQHLTALLANKASDAAMLKAAQAVVQSTVAHEVGHTLGLRHNFAGSLHADYRGHKRENLYADFLHNKPFDPAVLPSSSVMDYFVTLDDLLTSERFNRGHGVLPHDASAMKFLYQGKALDTSIPFCTDTDTSMMLDCRRHDYGRSPLEFASSSLEYALRADILPMRFYLDQVSQLLSDNSLAVADLRPSPASYAESLLTNKSLLLKPFTDKGYYARTIKRFFPASEDDVAARSMVVSAVRADLDAWIGANPLGMKSLTDMFRIVDPAWKDAWIQRFNALIDDPAYYTIVDYPDISGPKSRTFTPQERAQFKTLAAEFFDRLIPALAAEDVRQLLSVQGKIDVVDGTAGDMLLAALNATSKTYLLATTGNFLDATVNTKALKLPLFSYNWKLRQDASSLLSNRAVDSALWWGKRETEANEAALTTLLDDTVKPAYDSFDSTGVASGFAGASNSAAYQWYLEHQTIRNSGFDAK